MSNLSNTQLLLIALIVIVGVIVAMEVIVPLFKKKGVNVQSVAKEVEEVAEDAGQVIKVAQDFAPSNALNTLAIIDNLAVRASKAVQQLAISSQLPLEQRKATAKQYITDGLKLFNIPVTDDLNTLIDTAIEKCVLDSKTPEEQKAQEQNAYQKQIADLQTQLQQQAANYQSTIQTLTANNTTLQQQVSDLATKLNNVQAVVTPAVSQ